MRATAIAVVFGVTLTTNVQAQDAANGTRLQEVPRLPSSRRDRNERRRPATERHHRPQGWHS